MNIKINAINRAREIKHFDIIKTIVTVVIIHWILNPYTLWYNETLKEKVEEKRFGDNNNTYGHELDSPTSHARDCRRYYRLMNSEKFIHEEAHRKGGIVDCLFSFQLYTRKILLFYLLWLPMTSILSAFACLTTFESSHITFWLSEVLPALKVSQLTQIFQEIYKKEWQISLQLWTS